MRFNFNKRTVKRNSFLNNKPIVFLKQADNLKRMIYQIGIDKTKTLSNEADQPHWYKKVEKLKSLRNTKFMAM